MLYLNKLLRGAGLLILFFACSTAWSQLTLSNAGSPATVNVCSTGSFAVNVTRSAGAFVTGDSVRIALVLPSGMELSGLATASAGTVVVRNPSLTAPEFAVLGLATSTSFVFTYTVKAGCSRFSASTSTGLNNSFTATFNTSAPQSLSSASYNVSSAFLVFDPLLSTHLQNSAAPYLIPYERHYVFRNTSPVPFTGEFEWEDSVESASSLALIELLSASVTHPAFTLISASSSDTILRIRASVTGLASGDSIVVREFVRIVGCPVGFNRTSTLMTFHYGCTGDANLCTENPVPNYQTWALLTGAPGIAMFELTPSGGTGQLFYQCPANDEVRLMGVLNNGTAVADSMYFRLIRNPGGNISYFDVGQVQVYRNTPSGPVILTQTKKEYTFSAGVYTPNDTAHPYMYQFAVQGPIAPGDTLFVRWIEKKVCIDSADYDFNVPVIVNDIYEYAKFTHPCSPTGYTWPAGTFRGVWGFPIQKFDLDQVFENHTAYMNDEEQVWMRIDNKSPLFMSVTHPYFPDEVMVDPTKVQFQVEIQIDPGLGLIPDSLYLVSAQGGTDSIWYPTTVSVVYDDFINSTNGSRIIATFSMPSWFFKPNIYGAYPAWGAQWTKSASYLRFFNRFAVRFKVEAECEFAPPGPSFINQQTYFIYDTTCSPQCRFPLSSVGTKVNVLCPGCRVPGWNIATFTAGRTTFGWKDDNNDNHPDTAIPVPADASTANEKRLIIGDEVEINLTAFTSDGEVLLFNNIGFDYRFAELAILGRLLRDMEFLGGTGNLNGTNFTFPASHGYYITGDTFHFDLSLDTLAPWVTSGPPLPPKFGPGSFFDLSLRFRVKENLIYAGTYFNLEDVDAFIYQSGVPIRNTLGDAGPTETSLPILPLTGPQRAQYFYWCTGGGSRLTAIGNDFQYSNGVEAYSGIWGVTGIDFCYKKLVVQVRNEVGAPVNSEFWYHSSSDQAALNSFSYEVRDFILMDSISMVIPSDYELDHVDIRLSNLMLDTTTNQTRYICAPDWYAPYVYPMADVRQVDSTYTIFPSMFYQNLPTGFDLACGSTALDRGDETKRVQVQYILRMKDCHDVRDVINLDDYGVSSWISNVPEKMGDTAVYDRTWPSGLSLTAPRAIFNLQGLPLNTTTSTPNLTWTLNIAVPAQAGYWYDRTTAPSVFVYPISPSGAVDVTQVYNGATPLSSIGTWGPEQAWAVGTIWQDNSVSLTVQGTYNCAGITGQDSLLFVVGWNCYGYPTSLSEACYTDTVKVYVRATDAGLIGTLVSPAAGGPCDTLEYELHLNATGLGNIQHLRAAIPSLPGGEWEMIAGSGTVSVYGASPVPFNPVAAPVPYWDFDAIPAVLAAFNSSSGEIVLRFRVRTRCSYNLEDVVLNIAAETYCGKPIAFNLADRPSILTLPPSSATDSYAVSGLSCGIASGINFEILVPSATTFSNYVFVDLPAGFTFLANGLDTISIAIPVGFSGSIPVSLPVVVGSGLVCGSDYEVVVTQYSGTVVQCSPTEAPCSRAVVSSAQTCTLHVGNPSVTISTDGSCEGGCTTLQAVVTGGSGIYSYEWTEVSSSTVLGTADTARVCPALDTVYYHLLVTDVTGCTAEATIAVERCCQPPVLTCHDAVIAFNQELCGPFSPPAPDVISDCAITSLTNSWTGGAFPTGTTTVVWTAVNEFGDISTCTQTVTYLPATLVSSYTLLATQRVKLMSDNDVISGSVGVTSATGNAYVANQCDITSTGSAVRAATITMFPLTNVSNPVYSPAPVAMPPFHFNTAGTGPNINVAVNVTMTLTGSVYGTISLSKGATVIFSGSNVVNVQEIRVNNKAAGSGTTIRFAQCTELRVKGRMDLGPTCTVNPTHEDVEIYIEASNTGENDAQPAADIGSGSTVNARIYAPNGILYVHPGSNVAPAQMNGQFIAKWINGQPDVRWTGNPDCDAAGCTGSARISEGENFATPGLELDVYPNPVSDEAHIRFVQPVTGEVTLSIKTLNGVTVQTLYAGTAGAEVQYESDWKADLAAGVYFVTLQTTSGTAVRKLVVTH